MGRRNGYCDTCHNTGEVDCYCGGDLCVCGGETGYGTDFCRECDGEVASSGGEFYDPLDELIP